MPGINYPNESSVNQALSTVEALLASLQLVKSSLADLHSGMPILVNLLICVPATSIPGECHVISDSAMRELNGCKQKLLDAAAKLLILKSAAPTSEEGTIDWLATELKKAASLLKTDQVENETCGKLSKITFKIDIHIWYRWGANQPAYGKDAICCIADHSETLPSLEK